MFLWMRKLFHASLVVGSVALLLLKSNGALAFVTPTVPNTNHPQPRPQRMLFSSSSSSTTSSSSLAVPTSWEEMIRQAATAMRQAQEAGQTRQIVRVLLPRDANNDRLGTFYEASSSAVNDATSSSSSSSSVRMTLVPPDESWQGGIMQLYRVAAPTAERVLRQLLSAQAASSSGLPPRLTEDRSIDESGVDGVGLWVSDDQSVQCFVQPTQELVDDVVVDAAAKASRKDQLIVLFNPQWRQVDDALDTASQGEGFLSGLASFLGGKGATLKRLQTAGFEPVYTLEGYVCRGRNVRLLKILDSDWSIFYQNDDADDSNNFVSVGQLPKTQRPTYQDVDALMSEAGVSLGYARDMGL